MKMFCLSRLVSRFKKNSWKNWLLVLTLTLFLCVLRNYSALVREMEARFPPGFEIDVHSNTPDGSKSLMDGGMARRERESQALIRRSQLAEAEKQFIQTMEKVAPGRPSLVFDVKLSNAGNKLGRPLVLSLGGSEVRQMSLTMTGASGIVNPRGETNNLTWRTTIANAVHSRAELPTTTEEKRRKMWPGQTINSRSPGRIFHQLTLYTQEAKEAMVKNVTKKIGLIGGRFPWVRGRGEFVGSNYNKCLVWSCEFLPVTSGPRQLEAADAVLFKGEYVELPQGVKHQYFTSGLNGHVGELSANQNSGSLAQGSDDANDGTDAMEDWSSTINSKVVRQWRQARPDQTWIYYSLESAAALRRIRSASWPAEVFNWTATHRLDSDIPATYGLWYPKEAKENVLPLRYQSMAFKSDADSSRPLLRTKRNYAEGKTRLAAAFISNCDDIVRLAFIEALQFHIPVDVYGACGNFTCHKEDHESCLKMLGTHYKFYLAFENRRCRDYITEKFFVNALSNDVVPVVMGGKSVEDYLLVAPPDSFIHVDDFQSPSRLAKYIKRLDRNDVLYNRYFEWKSKGTLGTDQFVCRLCAMLHNSRGNEPYRKRIPDIYEWNNEEECLLNK